jgi:hypothetical protein
MESLLKRKRVFRGVTTPPEGRRICYICKTNFCFEEPIEEPEEEKPENIDELPTSVKSFKKFYLKNFINKFIIFCRLLN